MVTINWEERASCQNKKIRGAGPNNSALQIVNAEPSARHILWTSIATAIGSWQEPALVLIGELWYWRVKGPNATEMKQTRLVWTLDGTRQSVQSSTLKSEFTQLPYW